MSLLHICFSSFTCSSSGHIWQSSGPGDICGNLGGEVPPWLSWSGVHFSAVFLPWTWTSCLKLPQLSCAETEAERITDTSHDIVEMLNQHLQSPHTRLSIMWNNQLLFESHYSQICLYLWLHTVLLQEVPLCSPVFRWGNRGPEMWNNLSDFHS